ncbi:YqiA/YcfP family alpha/beta fold hydrolase [Eionea flava]
MPTLLYIHGFLSSPLSYKAQSLQRWLQTNRPDIRFCCPLLTPYPNECAKSLEKIVETALDSDEPIYLAGSSLGGFWATYLVAKYHLPAVLINPAVDALNLLPNYINQPLANYHTDDTYCLQEDDLVALSRYDTPIIQHTAAYWLLVQTGDETLDYRLAVEKYRQCRQTIEPGGDHSFQGFERFYADIMMFFETTYDRLR